LTGFVFSSSINFNYSSALWLLLGWGVGIGVIVWKILLPLFGSVRIGLNQQQMTVAYELLGLKYKLRPVPRQHICKLVHTKRYSRWAKLLEFSESFVVDEPRLIIWAGTKKYELCSGKVFSDPELDWLAQELSDWLRLPIARE
jgi:hypothetical protein